MSTLRLCWQLRAHQAMPNTTTKRMSGQDGEALDAGAAAVGAATGRGSGGRAAGIGRRAAGLVVEEIHPADPPFSGGWWARGDLNPHERKLTRP